MGSGCIRQNPLHSGFMRVYLTSRMLVIGLLGLYSGVPLALTASTLTAWLFDQGIERATIGLFAAVATPYACKFVWAPVLDGVRLPWLGVRLGRRRSWMLVAQAGLVAALLAMAMNDPTQAVGMTALLAVLVATFSATQDTVIDAYRVERLSREEQGAGAAMATFGYRIGMLLSGAGALALADHVGWRATYGAMAMVMASGMAVTLLARREEDGRRGEEGEVERSLRGGEGEMKGSVRGDEEEVRALHSSSSPSSSSFSSSSSSSPLLPPPLLPPPLSSPPNAFSRFIRDSVIAPFKDFMTRPYWFHVLLFVVLYKLGDAFMGIMFNPFLLDLGFTKTEIAEVVKLYGLIATILGSFAGGAMVARVGTYRTLMLCGFLHMLTNLLLVVQAELGRDLHFLTLTIASENFTGGMATAAFVAYLSALCKTHYTATQYALLSSLAAFGRSWLSTPSGALAAGVGWAHFFAMASLMAVPGLVLLWWLEQKQRKRA